MDITKIEKKQFFTAICIAVMILLTQMTGNTLLVAAALVLYLFAILKAPKGYIIPLMLFFLPWSPILKLSPGSISFASIATVMVLLVLLFEKTSIKASSLLSIMCLFAVTILSKVFHEYAFSASYIMFFIMLVAFPIIFRKCSAETDFEISVLFFSLGIILATVSSGIFSENVNISAYVSVLSDENAEVTRLCGFYSDPNFYAVHIVVAVGCLLSTISAKMKDNIVSILLIAALVICGLTSVSKSFLICLAALFLIRLLPLLMSKPSKFWTVSFWALVGVFIILNSGLFADTIEQYAIRFGNSTDTDSLTTGRSQIWEEYIAFFTQHPLEALFGQGYTSVLNGVDSGSHNTPIQMIYQLGIIGTVFMICWILSFRKSKSKTKFIPTLLLIVSSFSMWLGLDTLFFDDFFLIIVLFFLGINNNMLIEDNDLITAPKLQSNNKQKLYQE